MKWTPEMTILPWIAFWAAVFWMIRQIKCSFREKRDRQRESLLHGQCRRIEIKIIVEDPYEMVNSTLDQDVRAQLSGLDWLKITSITITELGDKDVTPL